MKKFLGIVFSFLLLMVVITAAEVKSRPDVEAQSLEDKVILYTTYSEDVSKYIKDEFKNKTKIDLEVKTFKDEAALKAQLDSEKDNPVADAVLGGSDMFFSSLVKAGELQAYNPSWNSDVNEDSKDKSGYWYAVNQSPLVMFYNNEILMQQDVPTTLVMLGDPKYKGKIQLPNTNSTEFKYILNSYIYDYFKNNKLDDGIKVLAAVKANVNGYKDSEDAIIKSIGAKEASIGFASLSKVNMAVKKGSKLTVAHLDDKLPTTINCVGICNKSKNINSAKLFEEFIAGPKMQLQLAQKFQMIPVSSKSLDLGEDWMKSIKNSTYNIDKAVFEANINTWVTDWNNAVIQPADNKANPNNPTNPTNGANNPAVNGANTNNTNNNAAATNANTKVTNASPGVNQPNKANPSNATNSSGSGTNTQKHN